MDESRYYYSSDGTDVLGPVTVAELHQLFHNEVIGPASHICREGESEWQVLGWERAQPQAAVPPPPSMPPIPTMPPSDHASSSSIIGSSGQTSR